ncbi:hypothetical protein AWH48_11935 [Domibacillus aminovorans]|uniref:Alpha-L-rhamnosidase six-hairpin glycosidase domain-containing protein n=1 Tax=Domibacillus aminovorans TaxID=29332 RepID=A0A177KI34_9BACI|nr:hypothetical protein [Domibacillus aminovorans]OAH53062.1 hypothetical protein AWH48_11935 [Domibacillus aminovorans]
MGRRRKIKFKRGIQTDLPLLDVGEPALTVDSGSLYIGGNDGNIEFASMDYVNQQLSSSYLTGTIDPMHVYGNPKIKFDGEETLSTESYPYLESYIPTANDRVLVAVTQSYALIMGKIAESVELTPEELNKKKIKYIARQLLNGGIVVTNQNYNLYTSSGYYNAPIGGVFNNINPTTTRIEDPTIDLPSTCWGIVALRKIYLLTGDNIVKNRALMTADFLANNLQEGTYYESPFKYMPNGFVWDFAGSWNPVGWGYHVRTQWNTLWALIEAYKLEPKSIYKLAIDALIDQAATWHTDIINRCNRYELAEYMKGAVYNLVRNVGGSEFIPEQNSFCTTTIDVITKAIQGYVELFGNASRLTAEGQAYNPQTILNEHLAWYLDCIANHGMRATTGHKMLYCFYHYDENSPLDENDAPMPESCNWDWLDTNDFSKDIWFTGDLEFWAIKGLIYNGQTAIAKSLLDQYYTLRVMPRDDVIFYDRYDKNGNTMEDDHSISTVFTALFMTCKDAIGETEFNDVCSQTLIESQFKSFNVDLDGGLNWDWSQPISLLETKSVGEMLYSPIEKYLLESSVEDIMASITDESLKLNQMQKLYKA